MDEKPFDLQWSDEAMLGVVVAADGYPGDVEKGNALPDLDELSQEYACFPCRNKIEMDKFVGNGGRVILVAAKAESLKEAKEKVYAGIDKYSWDHFFYRKDIGWRTFK